MCTVNTGLRGSRVLNTPIKVNEATAMPAPYERLPHLAQESTNVVLELTRFRT